MHTAEDNQLTIVVHEHFSQLVTFRCVKTITNLPVHCTLSQIQSLQKESICIQFSCFCIQFCPVVKTEGTRWKKGLCQTHHWFGLNWTKPNFGISKHAKWGLVQSGPTQWWVWHTLYFLSIPPPTHAYTSVYFLLEGDCIPEESYDFINIINTEFQCRSNLCKAIVLFMTHMERLFSSSSLWNLLHVINERFIPSPSSFFYSFPWIWNAYLIFWPNFQSCISL